MLDQDARPVRDPGRRYKGVSVHSRERHLAVCESYPVWGIRTVFKTMLERAIPVQQAFIRIYRGETHHVQRAVRPKNATILAYGDLAEEEKDIFRQLVARNASNMNFSTHEVLFAKEDQVERMVEKIVEKWEK